MSDLTVEQRQQFSVDNFFGGDWDAFEAAQRVDSGPDAAHCECHGNKCACSPLARVDTAWRARAEGIATRNARYANPNKPFQVPQLPKPIAVPFFDPAPLGTNARTAAARAEGIAKRHARWKQP